MATTRPTYAAAFRCIGPACEDPCCSGWDIPVDKTTYARLHQLPRENIGSLIPHFVVLNLDATHDNLYARIVPTPTGECPFWDADHLCGIHRTYGPELLPATCSIYPRALRVVDKMLEGSLSLSCPEAARNVLLDPAFMQIKGNLFSGEFRTDNFFHLGSNPRSAALEPHLHAIRTLLFEILLDRAYPLWQRVLWIGQLCTNLGNPGLQTLHTLDVFRQHHMQLVWKVHPANLKLRLEVFLAFTAERLADPGSGKRLTNTFWDFIQGIGSTSPAFPGEDLQRFQHAEENYHRPFFENSPHILENYLINYIFQNLFPLGREGAATRSVWDEYVLMAAQFAWIDTLLVGIAAHHKQDFCAEHVVHAIQSFTRAVEHYPDVLNQTLEYLKTRNLADMLGVAILLRP